MPRARREVVSLDDTPYYHCISRCVRRAFLCGADRVSGKDFSHRKTWMLERLKALSEVFAVEICAYAIMSNHYHLVVRVDREAALAWDEEEVVDRWTRLFSAPVLVTRHRRGETEGEEARVVAAWIERWRERLHDLSWFMRCLNEPLARQANAEDRCTGRFWEGRFKSQALLDEAGLLTCMAYVDLNPVRAGIARTPEESEFTSIEARIRAVRSGSKARLGVALKRFDPGAADGLPFTLPDYLELVDWSGRAILERKRGHIATSLPPILTRLGIDPAQWLRHMARGGVRFHGAVGRLNRLRQFAESIGRRWVCGQTASARLFRALPG